MALSKKQQAWVDAYIANGFRQNEACRQTGYSEKSGWWLRHRPDAARQIREAYENVGITKEEVMKAIARLVRSNLGDAMEIGTDKDGNETAYVDAKKAVESGLIADVSEIKMKRGGLIEIKLPDKPRVLGLAMKAFGMGDGTASEAEEEWWAAGDDV